MCQSRHGAWSTAMVLRHRKTALLILLLTIYSLQGFAWGATIVNPRQVSLGSTAACSLDDGGVHCWGINASLCTAQCPGSNQSKTSRRGRHCRVRRRRYGRALLGRAPTVETMCRRSSNPWQVSVGAASACAG